MIVRLWHGVVSSDRADDYHQYLLATGVPEYRATPGNRGVQLCRRLEGARAHFLLLSWWDSLEAIRAFAGPDIEQARYYPEDESYLVALERTVIHYEVLDDLPPTATR